MQRKILGLQFNDDNIILVETWIKKQNVKVKRKSIIEQKKGAIKDGNIIKIDEVKSLLLPHLMNKLFFSIPVVVGISGFRVFVRKLIVPAVPKKDLQKIIAWEGESILPYPVNDALFDYKIIGYNKGDYQILLTAILKERIQKYLALFSELKLRVKLLTLQPFGLLNYLEYENKLRNFNGIILRIQNNFFDIILFYHGELELIRTIKIVDASCYKDIFNIIDREITNTLEHFHSLKNVRLASGIFVGPEDFFIALKEKCSHLDLSPTDKIFISGEEVFLVAYGLALMGCSNV